MRKTMTMLTLMSFIFVAACGGQDKEPLPEITDQERALAESSNDFGFELFAQLGAEAQENVFISPLSVSMALGMTLNGARGDTLDAMQATLGLDGLDLLGIDSGYATLLDLLMRVDPKVQVEIANSVWVRQDFQVAAEFTTLLAEYFFAGVTTLDFDDPASVDVINAWVADATHGKIDSILDSIPPYAVLYLINAVYFKGDWTQQFDKDLTRSEAFHLADGGQRNVPTMFSNTELPYLEQEDLQAVELAYGDGFFAMTLLLPAADASIDDLVAELDADAFAAISAALTTEEVILYLPSFELEYEKSLVEALAAMGMDIAFSAGADFGGISEQMNLAITEVKHKTYVKVDEEGTEAAAVTSVEIGVTSAPAHPVMRIDRPFVLVISERSTGALLFMGKIMDPAA